MALDLSRLTSAVNKYLNSISKISTAAQKASEEIAEKTRFSAELNDAIMQNIQSRTRDVAQMPDIAGQVQDAVTKATSGIESEIEQIRGSFEAIREAGVTSVDKSSGDKAAGEENPNRDAYSGVLSTQALQELSKSQYFSANLLQSSLFDVLDDNEQTTAATGYKASNSVSSAFDSLSLSDLNTESLLSSAGLSTDALSSATAGDLAKNLIKAYSNSAASSAATSIFGDFTL